ncbi:MAG: class I SAM-dependent methyltransferase [Tepidisphaeraceae bacterium]
MKPDAAPDAAETEAFLNSQTVPGWMTEAESRELYRLAAGLPNTNPVCCEIGTWIGKSAVLISTAMKHKVNAKLYCVDPFDLVATEPWHEETFTAQMGLPLLSRKATFLRTLHVHGVSHIASPIQGFSQDSAAAFGHELDLLFIDGDHSYQSVLRDYQAWSPKLKPGGILCFHDYHPPEHATPHDGPRRVVHEHIVGNPQWARQRRTEKLYVAVKVK